MEWLKNMPLKKSFFWLTFGCLLASLVSVLLIWALCSTLAKQYPSGGIAIGADGTMTYLAQPTPEQERFQRFLLYLPFLASVLLPLMGLGLAAMLFYQLKLKAPLAVLQESIQRVQNHDLDFSIPYVSADELGQICQALETMRAQLLKTNQELWRQSEERKRLNAAFSHDLRNPVTVLKGTVHLLRQGVDDEQAISRLEAYTLRIEQYIEAMSSVQRLEALPVKAQALACAVLEAQLAETAKFLAPSLEITFSTSTAGQIWLDHSLFLTVAENLLSNAARFAHSGIQIGLSLSADLLILSVIDDGPGFPAELLQSGPKPFGRQPDRAAHFGMGLYISQLLCQKHGGSLELKNQSPQGAAAIATFQITRSF